MKMKFRNLALASVAFASMALLSPSLSGVSVSKADAARLYVGRGYAASAVYVHSAGLPWYAVRAAYWGGPWSGPGYSYTGWADYRARNGIGCDPGGVITGGDGIVYRCQ